MERTGQMKIGVIGAGAVGSACLLSSILRGVAREIVVVNRERMRAKAVVTDLQYGAALSSVVQIRDGDYSDLTGKALVMITAGMNEKAGGATNRNDPAGRLKLLESNVGIYRQILPEIFRTVPEAVILVVTDPPDPLADFVRTFGFTRVLSTGTFLDSLRFRFHVARHLNVDPASVDANVLGEHGTSEVFMWSSAQVAGVRVLDALQQTDRGRDELRRTIEEEVRYANITIIEAEEACHAYRSEGSDGVRGTRSVRRRPDHSTNGAAQSRDPLRSARVLSASDRALLHTQSFHGACRRARLLPAPYRWRRPAPVFS